MELWLGQACGKDMKVWHLDQALASAHATPLRRLRRDWSLAVRATFFTLHQRDRRCFRV